MEAIENTVQDPALTETQIVEIPAQPEEKRFEFQPTDDQGRPVGGKQVIKYRTAEELGEKMAEQNKLLILKLRSETRKNRLGIVEDETISEEAPRFEQPVSFKRRVLTPEERFQLSRDLLDPEKFEEASGTLIEATLGATPQVVSDTLTELQQERINARALSEVNAFRSETPEYVMCQENSEAITNWLVRYNLAPVKDNFTRAYNALREAKVLIETIQDLPEPVTAQEIVPAEEVIVENLVTPVVEAVVAPVVEHKPVVRIPTGLTRDNSADAGTPRNVGDEIVYEVDNNGQKRRFTGLAAVNAMTSAEYKKRVLTDPTFQPKVEKLEKDRAEQRRNRQQQ